MWAMRLGALRLMQIHGARRVNKRHLTIAVLSLLTLGLDQGTKIWARSELRGTGGLTVISNYLDLRYYENTGMAFSMGRNLPGGRYIFVAVGLLVLFAVWRLVRQVQHRKTAAEVAFAMVVAGALGNLIDRVAYGHVVDFILMHWQRKYTWPAYNVADIALCVGAGLFMIALSGTKAANRSGSSQTSSRSARERGAKRRARKRA